MEDAYRADSFPKVGQDDFLEMLTMTTDGAWQELAHEQPELAREIEQQAVHLRMTLESGAVSSLESQKAVIDLAVFVAEAIIHAFRRSLANTPPQEEPPQIVV